MASVYITALLEFPECISEEQAAGMGKKVALLIGRAFYLASNDKLSSVTVLSGSQPATAEVMAAALRKNIEANRASQASADKAQFN